MEKQLFTPLETAEVLGVSRAKVYELLATGELASVKIHRSRRITPAHIHQFIQSLEGAN